VRMWISVIKLYVLKLAEFKVQVKEEAGNDEAEL
jgi:hypothetical protein